MVWAALGALILALVAGAGQGPASFTVVIPTSQVSQLDRSTWRPIYQLQRLRVNGPGNCLESENVAHGHVQSLTWESAGVRVNVTTTASLNPTDPMLWVFSTTPNQPRLVIPFSQEGAASGIDYSRLMSTHYCP